MPRSDLYNFPASVSAPLPVRPGLGETVRSSLPSSVTSIVLYLDTLQIQDGRGAIQCRKHGGSVKLRTEEPPAGAAGMRHLPCSRVVGSICDHRPTPVQAVGPCF